MPTKNWLQAAAIVWPMLTAAAKFRRTLNYRDIAPRINTNPLSVGRALGPIQSFCLGQSPQLPPLTALVVQKGADIPGMGFIAWPIDDFEEAKRLVFGYDWDTIVNPFQTFKPDESEEAFVDRLLRNPDQASTVYARVAVRGVAQDIFRAAVRKAYVGQCAMCGLSFRSALESAHIIPWRLSTPAQRMDPRNGILLCAVHHRLFDLGAITVSESYKIAFPHPRKRLSVETPTDRHVTVRIAKQSLRLPKKSYLCPSLESLRHHHKAHEWGAVP